ncbi:uncharacterized protein A4U43_C03F170 [Asparagus officinalis]|uniref:Uncharacterized protein n=1 Tax=Asparagus officinalis TaxID=4686 RepID=A0A5P1F633_ASPOF|nr:uncharacterized protein A4U43_C03F170 [Asparagus officinalis]
MATPLGKSFSDEEVVVQSDVHLTGTTVETLVIEFDQAKFEEVISSGSLSLKAMRKIHKVSKKTKTPTVAPMPKKAFSFNQGCSNSPSPDGVGSVSAKPVPIRRLLLNRSQGSSGSNHLEPYHPINLFISYNKSKLLNKFSDLVADVALAKAGQHDIGRGFVKH